MFNYFNWELSIYKDKKILKNKDFGIEIFYSWDKKSWEFFIYPVFDQNSNTYINYAFDDIEKKIFFERVNKLPWIWPKTAYHISCVPVDKLKKAIEGFDIQFFQTIPWIWAKTSRRIVVELKSSFDEKDIRKLDIDSKIFNDILSSLKTLWYDKTKIKKVLEKCPIELKKENLQNIIKWILDNV